MKNFKILNYLKLTVKLLVGCLFSFVIILFSFFKKIRIYKIHHFLGATQYLEIYIYEKRKGIHDKYIDFFVIDKFTQMCFFDSKKYNKTFLKLILTEINNKEFNFNILNIFFHFFISLAYDFKVRFNLSKYIIPIYNHEYLTTININNLDLSKKAINIKYKNINEFDILFKSFLKQYNIKNYNSLITYANRDKSYKEYQYKDKNWSYHDFRNFSVETFEQTISFFCQKKILNVRVGNITNMILKLKNNYFIDYSKSDYVSEYLDIYLIYKSKFFVGCGSGLDKVASFLKVPILFVNQINISYIPHYIDKSIFIPNILLDLETNKRITFKDQINPNFKKDKITGRNISKYATSDEFKRNNVKIIYNSSEEIMNGAKEINLLSENKFILNKSDLDLQTKFWKILTINKISSNFYISPSFLNKNLDLLK